MRSLPVADLLGARAAAAVAARRRGARPARQPRAAATLRVLQAPAPGDWVSSSSRRARPGADARSDARRRQRVRRPSRSPPTELDAALDARHGEPSRPRPAGRSSRSSAPRAASARRRSPSTSRRRSQQPATSTTLLIDLHLSHGDAARLPRRRAALLGGRRAREHPSARRGVLREPRRRRRKCGVDLLGFVRRGRSGRWTLRRVADAARLRGHALPLHRPRRAAVRRGGARRARRRRRRSSSSRTRSWRRCAARPHGGGAAPALRQGARDSSSSAGTTGRPRSARKTSNAWWACQSSTSFPSDYRPARRAR